MESRKLTILVPTDFTEIADYAVDHAVKVSKLLNKDITLLHIVKEDTEIPEAEQKIQEQAGEIFRKYQIKPYTIIREGSIFTTIGEVSNELHAEMVIMGTHGRKGVQKLTGSWALKVIVKSKAPCIVVQGMCDQKPVEKIVFPIDFKKENIEKIGWALMMAKHFNSKVYIFKATSKVKFLGFIRFNDKIFFKNIFSNTRTTEKYFKNNDIDFEVVQAEPMNDFVDQTIEFSQKIGADLILITTTKSISISDYILGASEQRLIDNHAKIPVMCVNPRPKKVGSFSASGA